MQRLKQDGIDVQTLSKDWVLKDELSFDVKRKLASYVYQYGNSKIALSSGAPEKILENSRQNSCSRVKKSPLTDALRNEVSLAIAKMAHSGERLLAFGYHRLPTDAPSEKENLEKDIVFVGIIGFIDPPRKEVKGAIQTCQEAGIKVIMITGDHPETAKTIANQVGINSSNVLTGVEIAKMTDADLKEALKNTYVFARVTPEDKLRLVQLTQGERRSRSCHGRRHKRCSSTQRSTHRHCNGHPRNRRCQRSSKHDSDRRQLRHHRNRG